MNNFLEKRYEHETGEKLIPTSNESIEKYFLWRQKLEKSNRYFAEVVSEYAKPDDLILELASSSDENVLKYMKDVVYSYMKIDQTPKIQDKSLQYRILQDVDELSCYLIANGIFKEEITLMNQVLRKGHFTIGLCGEKHSPTFRAGQAYYKGLRNFCQCNGISVEVIEKNVDSSGKMKVYALNHNLKGRGRK